ncbi:virulence factor TspB C-terminal domain-related protein [Acidovorax sp. Root568]|uniref:virulence factor TspB C-terminal domain-related protein n=1 Tax=Acidovorax sp. Root568 TaxID=1736565 RepID=UPI000AEDFAE1|nr:virulence factor TspB C-terminal domain-related protein [Acidovorax sp. Root568]
MADLYRLIVAVLLLCFGPPALADGGPFPATPGQWNTASCNSTNFPVGQLGAGISASWTCKATANPKVQDCGYTYNNGYYDGKCTQQKGPDSCPSGSTMSTSGSGASVCTCGAGLVPFDGGCKEKPQCQPGTHDDGTGHCVRDNCKEDETRVGEDCIKDPPCPPGTTRVGKKCKPNKCKAGTSAGDYTDLSDSVTYLCEMSDGLNCQVRVKPTICVRFDGQESCTGAGVFTGAACTGGNGGTGGGNGPSDNGGDNGGSNGGTGNGGTGNGGTGNGGTGNGGNGTGGGGTGNGGTGNGGTGNGGTGNGGTGNGGTGNGGTGNGGTANGGTGNGGTGNGGSGPSTGTGGPTLPPPIVIPPPPDGKCPPGFHKSGDWCVKNPEAPDGDGKCPEGSIKINGKCVYTEPPSGGGGGTGTGGGGTGNGNGDGEDDGSGFGGSCMSGYACEGDAIQCAIAKEQYARNCKLFDDTSAESDLYNANKGKTGNQTGDLPGNETISLSGRIDTSDPLGGGGCIGDLSVTVWGQGVSLPLSNLCQYLAMLGNILVAVSMLLAARIVTRG